MGNIRDAYCKHVKQLIYRCKCLRKNIRFEDIITEIKMVQNIERTNARMINKMNVHRKKWKKSLLQNDNDETHFNCEEFIANYVAHM